MTERFVETLCPGYGQAFDVERVLLEHRTGHQHLVIFENASFGRVMALDGIVQTTERDEFVYHEMLAHVALLAHGHVRRALVIGGGDGGTLREVLRHRDVEEAVVVEIDEDVVDLCREWFPGHSDGAFDDPRARVLIDDGLRFVADTAERFDAVFVDSTDPVGPGEALYSPEFYAGCRRCLADGGVLAGHAGVAWFQTEAAVEAHRRLAEAFPRVALYGAAVPTYVGGVMAFLLASVASAPHEAALATLRERYARAGLDTGYYSPEVHAGAFAMPRYLVEAIAHGRSPPGPQWDARAHVAPDAD